MYYEPNTYVRCQETNSEARKSSYIYLSDNFIVVYDREHPVIALANRRTVLIDHHRVFKKRRKIKIFVKK
jgi:hypothetical protein